MIPISYPGIVTAASMSLFMSWGDMVFSLTFLNQEKLKTLPLILYKAMGELGVRWEILMAYSTLVCQRSDRRLSERISELWKKS